MLCTLSWSQSWPIPVSTCRCETKSCSPACRRRVKKLRPALTLSGTPANGHAAAEVKGVKIEPGVATSQATPEGKSQPVSVAGAKRKSRAKPDSPESNDENESGAANSSQPTKRPRARTALIKMEIAQQATPSGTPGATLPCLGHTLPLMPGSSCVCCLGQQGSRTCEEVPAVSKRFPALLYLAFNTFEPWGGSGRVQRRQAHPPLQVLSCLAKDSTWSPSLLTLHLRQLVELSFGEAMLCSQ